MAKDILGTMKKDVLGWARDTVEGNRQNLEEVIEFGKETIVNAPRNIAYFATGLAQGYAYQQVWSSANVYTGNVSKKLRTDMGGSDILGLFVGSAQDTATIVGTMMYAGGVDNQTTLAATIIAGSKVVSNITAASVKWYQSAKSRD